MLDSLIRISSSWNETLQIVVVAFLVMGLSPYGVFFIKLVLAYRRGAPLPRLVRGKDHKVTPVKAVIDEANLAIEEAERHIDELEEKLEEYLHKIEQLHIENAILKERLHNTERPHAGGHAQGSAKENPPPDYIVEALAGIWLPATPLPSWDRVKLAYRDAVKIHHPDRGGDVETIKQVNAFYDVLKKYYNQ